MRFVYLVVSVAALFLLHTSALGQGITGKWRWQVKGTDKDLQSDYLLELDLKQEGSRVFGTRTLYLRNFDNIIIWMEGEITSKGLLSMSSKTVVQFNLPDSILAAKQFTFQFDWNKSDKNLLTGLYTPQEDPEKIFMRKLDPYFYDVIYKVPVRSRFVRLADTVSTVFREIITKQLGPQKEAPMALAPVKLPTPREIQVETEIEHTLTIPAEDVLIELYDNGTIDGDIVTVIINDKVMTQHQKLGLSPITIKIKKEDLNDSTMLIMQAENLGDIPPNTALMLITVAGKRYDLNISSTMQKRAAVMLYKMKGK